jgi:hypothetical protein
MAPGLFWLGIPAVDPFAMLVSPELRAIYLGSGYLDPEEPDNPDRSDPVTR